MTVDGARRSRVAGSRRAGAALALSCVVLSGCSETHSTASAPSTAEALATARPAAVRATAGADDLATPLAAGESGATVAPANAAAPPTPTSAQPTLHLAPLTRGIAPVSDGPPTILSAVSSPNVVHAGDTVHWVVHTSANVVTVTAAADFYVITLTRARAGVFVAPFTIPAAAPGIFHGDYDLKVTASTADGRSATSSMPVSFR